MFHKRLRFSILLLILIANCHSSHAQASSGISTSEWIAHDLNTYPPKVNDDQYLYFSGSTSDLRGLKIEVKSIPDAVKVTSAEVTFEYWGYGGEPTDVDADGYAATSLFSLGVSFQSEARPQTIWANFSDSNLGNKKGDQWSTFETHSTDPIYPARIMITPVPTTTEKKYYVAIKNIEVVYFYEDSKIELQNVTDEKGMTEKNVTTQISMNSTLTCNPNSCDTFVLTNGASYHWSDLYFPKKPTSFSTFYTPNGSSVSPFTVTLNKTESTDTCISVNYWLTAGAHLTVSMGSSTSTLTLSPTYLMTTSTDNSMYDWYKISFCLSQFFFNLIDGQYDLSLAPSMNSANDYIAIGEVTGASITNPELTKPQAKMILQSWSKSFVKPTDEWFYLPDVVSTDSSSLIIKTFAPGNGNIYVVSSWFNMSSGLNISGKMEITSCPSMINVTLQLIDSDNNLIDIQSSDLCSTPSTLISNKTYPITQGTIDKAHRLQFEINYSQDAVATPAILTLSAVDLSDACRLDGDECTKHGTCTVTEPNVAKCNCDSGYSGDHCQDPDYCVLSFTMAGSTTSINGSDYCITRGGNCTTSFNPETRAICDCESTKYWKYDQVSDYSCTEFDPCPGINAFCPTGTACVLNTSTNTASCSGCDTTNGYVKNETSGNCIKSDACTTCLEGSLCKTDPSGNAVCYCENGVTYDTENGCTPSSCSDLQKSLRCAHTCNVELEKPECVCFDGWNMTEGSKTECEQNENFECTVSCSVGAICTENNGGSVCSCLPGYVMIDSKCVNICEGAALNNTEAKDQVMSICGTSTCTIDQADKLMCDCAKPYVRGSDGRCKIDKTCLTGGQGHSRCSALGAICQPRIDAVNYDGLLYQCDCPIGTYKSDNEKCIDQCSMGEKTCLFDNAVCQKSTILGATQHECVCQPGLKKSATDNRCYLIERSLRIEMVVRLDEREITSADTTLQKRITSYYMAPATTDTCSRYAGLDISGCIDYLTQSAQEKAEMQKPAIMEATIQEMLKTTLKSDLANVYGSTFGDINIITYSKNDSTSLGGDYKAIISVELTDPTIDTKSHLISLNDEAVCHPIADTIPEASSYCFIPTSSVIQRNSIVQTELLPCNETYINYCPVNTQCNPLNYSRFSCDCNPGFKAETVIGMDGTDRTTYYKEYCEDINECDSTTSPCREHSTCFNTIGGYQCPCNHEYIEDKSTGTCISVCSTVECVYGDCYVVANNTGACRCHEGYRGETCEEQDPLVTTFRTALITVAVVLGLLLVGVVLVAVILIKKTKRSAMQKNAERPMAEYGRPQVPKRYQDNSGFTND